jgi:hypothetical protein
VSTSIRRVPAIALVLAAAAFGCHSVPVTYEAPAAGTFDVTAGKPVAIGACGVQLFGVIPIRTNSRQKRAYDALRRNAPNSVLVDIRQQERWYFIFAGHLFCTSLNATAYPVSK